MNHQKTESPEKTRFDSGPGRRVLYGRRWEVLEVFHREHTESSKSFWILKDQDALATLSSPPFWDDGEWVNTWPQNQVGYPWPTQGSGESKGHEWN